MVGCAGGAGAGMTCGGSGVMFAGVCMHAATVQHLQGMSGACFVRGLLLPSGGCAGLAVVEPLMFRARHAVVASDEAGMLASLCNQLLVVPLATKTEQTTCADAWAVALSAALVVASLAALSAESGDA